MRALPQAGRKKRVPAAPAVAAAPAPPAAAVVTPAAPPAASIPPAAAGACASSGSWFPAVTAALATAVPRGLPAFVVVQAAREELESRERVKDWVVPAMCTGGTRMLSTACCLAAADRRPRRSHLSGSLGAGCQAQSAALRMQHATPLGSETGMCPHSAACCVAGSLTGPFLQLVPDQRRSTHLVFIRVVKSVTSPEGTIAL